MTSKPGFAEIMNRCLEAYGSLSSISFEFMDRAIEQAHYTRIRKEMETRFTLVDDTDFNDDVCFFYILELGSRTWGLLLSMVGPYALFTRHKKSSPSVVLTPESTGLDDIEKDVMTVLSSEGVHLLDTAILEELVDFQDPTTGEVEPSPLFRVLFTDTTFFPWRGLPPGLNVF